MCQIRNVPDMTLCISQTLMLVIFYDILITWMVIYFNNKCCFHTMTVVVTDNISALTLTVSTNIKTPVACFL